MTSLLREMRLSTLDRQYLEPPLHWKRSQSVSHFLLKYRLKKLTRLVWDPFTVLCTKGWCQQRSHPNLTKNFITFTISVTRCGDLLPFWWFLERFGNLFFRKLPKLNLWCRFFAFENIIYLLWQQIWQFLRKCWRLFHLNTWSHCFQWRLKSLS